jgi:hypothetical protein
MELMELWSERFSAGHFWKSRRSIGTPRATEDLVQGLPRFTLGPGVWTFVEGQVREFTPRGLEHCSPFGASGRFISCTTS